MALKLHIPTLNGSDAAQELMETLRTSEPNAKIDLDLETKMITVESQASEETFKQLIQAVGHEVSAY